MKGPPLVSAAPSPTAPIPTPIEIFILVISPFTCCSLLNWIFKSRFNFNPTTRGTAAAIAGSPATTNAHTKIVPGYMVRMSYGSFQHSCHHYISSSASTIGRVQQALDIHTLLPSPPPVPSVTLVADDMAGIEAKEKVATVVEEEKHEENGNETEDRERCRRLRLPQRQTRRPFLLPLLPL